MSAIQHGATAAAEELYDRYSSRLLHYFYRTLGADEEKAQDFLQDIFLKIVEKPNLFNTEKKFASWIFSVALNMCKNEYRRLDVRKIIKPQVAIDSIATDVDPETERRIDHQIFEKALTAALEKLDHVHRNTFLLRFQQQFSIKEISEIEGCAEGTVKSRLFYTMQQLSLQLRDFNPYE